MYILSISSVSPYGEGTMPYSPLFLKIVTDRRMDIELMYDEWMNSVEPLFIQYWINT